MSPGRDSFDGGAELPNPVLLIPDELGNEVEASDVRAAAMVVSVPRLVVRRLVWAVAPVLARLADWMGRAAATAARKEAAAAYALVVTRYERKLLTKAKEVHKWRTAAEARQIELEAQSGMLVRLTARVAADTTAVRLVTAAATQQAG